MKTLNLKSVIFAASLVSAMFITSSCSDDEKEDNNPPPSLKNKISVNINGTGWSGDVTILRLGGVVNMTARKSSNSYIILTVPEDSLGTYDFPLQSWTELRYADGSQGFNDLQSGTVTIIENTDSIVRGSFDAVIAASTTPGVTDTVVMTNGNFNYTK